MIENNQNINIPNNEEENITLYDSNNKEIINNDMEVKNRPIILPLLLIIICIIILIYSYKQNNHKLSSQKNIFENNVINMSYLSNITNISIINNSYRINIISSVLNINNISNISNISNTNNISNINKIVDIQNTTNINNISNITYLENLTNIVYEDNISDFNNANIIDQNLTDKINFDGLSQRDIFIKGKHFLYDCLRGKLMNNITNKSIDEPEISIIIPVYNGQKYIKNVIRSIQNQNFDSMEIILMDDFSKDNSLNIIKEMQKEDKRIKFIINQKNKGILYTRCMGALAAKGKYIFTIDMDDLFFDYDVINTIYQIAEKGNYDIVAFSAVDIKDYKSDIYKMIVNRFHDKTNNLIIKQPELGVYPISDGEGKYLLNDPHLWGKCIKTEIYQKAVKDLGEERYSIFNCWNEDQIILFVICNLSQSYIFIRKFGIFHYVHKESSTMKYSYLKKRYEEIFLLNIIFEFSRGENKKFAVYKAIQFRNWMGKILTRRYIVKVEPILQKIMKCEEIDKEYKEQLIESYRGRIDLKKYLNLNDTANKSFQFKYANNPNIIK